MVRCIRTVRFILGLAAACVMTLPAAAQQFRSPAFPTASAPSPLLNNFNVPNPGNAGFTSGGIGPTTIPFASVPFGAFNTTYFSQLYGNPYLNPSFTSSFAANGVNNNQTSQGPQRGTSTLANPMNFYQYGQITGTGPNNGTVATYSQFGLLGSLYNPYSNVTSGVTSGGNPPPGVLLSVNYGQMFLPNQSTVNNGGYPYGYLNPYSNSYGPFGSGYPNPYGYPSPFNLSYFNAPPVKQTFGNGGNGI